MASLESVFWSNYHRLMEPLGDLLPAECEDLHH